MNTYLGIFCLVCGIILVDTVLVFLFFLCKRADSRYCLLCGLEHDKYFSHLYVLVEESEKFYICSHCFFTLSKKKS